MASNQEDFKRHPLNNKKKPPDRRLGQCKLISFTYHKRSVAYRRFVVNSGPCKHSKRKLKQQSREDWTNLYNESTSFLACHFLWLPLHGCTQLTRELTWELTFRELLLLAMFDLLHDIVRYFHLLFFSVLIRYNSQSRRCLFESW